MKLSDSTNNQKRRDFLNFFSATLSVCPKNTVIADMIIENILHRKSYRKISKERYIPMNPKDFYGYRRKTVAVLYERMRLLGMWEE